VSGCSSTTTKTPATARSPRRTPAAQDPDRTVSDAADVGGLRDADPTTTRSPRCRKTGRRADMIHGPTSIRRPSRSSRLLQMAEADDERAWRLAVIRPAIRRCLRAPRVQPSKKVAANWDDDAIR